jgi:hypothetical protein
MTRPALRIGRHVQPILGGHTAVAAMETRGLTVRSMTLPITVVNDAWLEAPIDDHWTAAYRLTMARGKPEVSELRVFPTEPDFRNRPEGEWTGAWLGVKALAPRHGLTAKVLRQVRLHLHLAEVPKILAHFKERGVSSEFVEPFGLSLPTPPDRRRGRKPLPDEFLAGVAHDYAAAAAAGSKHPLRDVAVGRGADIAVVRGWVHKARERRLLIGGAWGKPAGTLSPAGAILLDRQRRARDKTSRRSTRHTARRK